MNASTIAKQKTKAKKHVKPKVAVDLTIVGGAGHVGLPLALAFANKNLRVMLFDLNQQALDLIESGQLPAIENNAEELLQTALKNKNLYFTSDLNELPNTGPIIITIGTPVDEFLNPVHTIFKKCFDQLLPILSNEHFIILRSTVFPGTTEWLQKYFQQQGLNTEIAFCPERIVQGNAIKELASMPQIISGMTPNAEHLAAKLFRLIAPEIVCVKPIEAEFAKLFTNAYRYIQFAISNQFYTIADAAGVDYYNIIHAMTKSYPRMVGFPSAGFAAGPCLFKDTMQLSAFAQNQFSIGHAAMLINEGLPMYIVDNIRKSHNIKDITIGLLGMAFKSEIDDIRSSLSYKLKKTLSLYAKEVLTTDPYVKDDPSLLPLDEVIEKSDLLIHCAPHKCYQKTDFKDTPIIDVWGIFRDA